MLPNIAPLRSRFGRYCETSVEPGDLQAMCELCRQRFYIIDMASDLKRKVIALLISD